MSSAPTPVKYAGVRSRFLENVADGDAKTIVCAATLRQFPARTILFNPGDPAQTLFLLVEGRARHYYITREGQKILLPWLVPGDVFGIAALLPESPVYLVSTETVTDSSILVWDRATVRELAERVPRILGNAFSIATEQMHWAIDAHVGLVCHSAKERLAQTLFHLAQNIGRKGKDGIELDLRNEELAETASVTRFTASRLMREWHRQGILKKGRGKVLLRFPERLFEP